VRVLWLARVSMVDRGSQLAATVVLPLAVLARHSRRAHPDTWVTSTRKVDMVRAIVYFFIAVVALGTIATPGLGAFALVLVPLLGLGFLWRVGLTVATRGHATEAVAHIKTSQLLGPGGPDDSFAASPLRGDQYPTEASASAPVSTRNGARNGVVRGTNVPRPGFSAALSVRASGENSIQGGRG